MKLRISGNSIRLRLSVTDVTSLVDLGSVSADCNIGSGTLTYQISQDNNQNILSASFADGYIEVKVPKDWLTNWDNDERIGFDGNDPNGLYILVEKDFQCIKPRPQEDESDLYNNPQTNDTSHA